ncbi:MAG: hypothetical protein NT004_04340 [Bacteroidetes bacterium]|nr:hypothetical protein [Bacteroidota bacterium]
MKKILTALSSFLILLIMFTGCYNDNEYDLYPFIACDSSNVTYSQTISLIMTANCNVCHSSLVPNGNVVTDNYNRLSSLAKSVNDSLWAAVNHISPLKPMPKNAAQLSSCDLGKIKQWINAGAPNN